MTFPGEAVELDFANVISGAPFSDFGDAIRWEDSDTATSTVTVGDAFIVGWFDSQLLASGDDCAPRVAFVVAGGSGTLRVSSGRDPDFTLDDPGDATDLLGTLTVTGAGEYTTAVIPGFDVDEYLAETAYTIAYVECLTGTVEIQQVKLYLHPTGGPVGGWVTAPGFTATATPDIWNVGGPSLGPGSIFTGGEPVGPYEDAAEELVTRWGADDRAIEPDTGDWVAASALSADVFASASVAVQTLIPLNYVGGDTAEAAASIAQQTDPDAFTRSNTPTFGEAADVAFSPYKVPGDLGVQLLGSPSVAWGDATLAGSPTWDLIKSGAGYTLSVISDDATTDPTGVNLPSGYAVALPGSSPTSDPVSMPDARTVLLSMSADILTAPAPYSADNANGDCEARAQVGVSITLADSIVTIPGYRYWSPSASGYRPLRQWPLDEGNGGTPTRYGGRSTSRLTSGNNRGYQ